MFDFINEKICHIINLILLASASKHTKCAPLSNQKFTTQPTLINLHILMNTLKDYATIHLQLV